MNGCQNSMEISGGALLSLGPRSECLEPLISPRTSSTSNGQSAKARRRKALVRRRISRPLFVQLDAFEKRNQPDAQLDLRCLSPSPALLGGREGADDARRGS